MASPFASYASPRVRLTLLDNNRGNTPPPANSQDDYGTQGNSYDAAKNGDKPYSPNNDLDDDIPF